MTAFQWPTRQSYLVQFEKIAGRISRSGYALIDARDTDIAIPKEVSKRFGSIQKHIRANAGGICGITTADIVNRDWED